MTDEIIDARSLRIVSACNEETKEALVVFTIGENSLPYAADTAIEIAADILMKALYAKHRTVEAASPAEGESV